MEAMVNEEDEENHPVIALNPSHFPKKIFRPRNFFLRSWKAVPKIGSIFTTNFWKR